MALALTIAIAAGVWMIAPWRSNEAAARTVLILPLEVRGQTDGADYVGRAFAEALAVNLAQVEQLNVLQVPESNQTTGSQPLASRRQARSAGAGRLLTGALTRQGRKMQASLTLIDVDRDRILWGASKDTDDDQLPGLAASLAREVTQKLGSAPPKLYDYILNLTGSPEMAASPDASAALGALRRREIPDALEATAPGRVVSPRGGRAHAAGHGSHVCLEPQLSGESNGAGAGPDNA